MIIGIIVAIDSRNGICKDGKVPWKNPEDLLFFRNVTTGDKNNAVLMGRLTYESLPNSALKNRVNIIVSKSMPVGLMSDNVVVYGSLSKALSGVKIFDNLFIIGGSMIYNEMLEKYHYLCDVVYVTKINGDFHCDKFFPLEKLSEHFVLIGVTFEKTCTRYVFSRRR